MDSIVHVVAKSQTQLNNFHYHFHLFLKLNPLFIKYTVSTLDLWISSPSQEADTLWHLCEDPESCTFSPDLGD